VRHSRKRRSAIYNLSKLSEVYALFSSRPEERHVEPRSESFKVALVAAEAIDWASLAFPTVREAPRHWIKVTLPLR
jgi:hypothetical protein